MTIELLAADVDLSPDDVYLECEKGRRTGKCYVYVKSEADLLKCLEKHQEFIGERYVNGEYCALNHGWCANICDSVIDLL